MNNKEIRALAQKKKASFRAFDQGAYEGGNCLGYVSWWVRRRLQGKLFWDEKKFTELSHEGTTWYNAEEEEEYDFNLDKMMIKRTDLGLIKARRLQKIFINNNKDRRYITHGDIGENTRGENKKALKEVASFISNQSGIPISGPASPRLSPKQPHSPRKSPQQTRSPKQSLTRSNSYDNFPSHNFTGHYDVSNAQNLKKSFYEVKNKNYVAKYSFLTNDLNAHTVGLDCFNGPNTCYFDPNLGEFEFASVDQLFEWWQECYSKRAENQKSAFDIFSGKFSVDRYQKK